MHQVGSAIRGTREDCARPVLAQRNMIDGSMKRTLLNIDTAAAFVRHITPPKNDMLLNKLEQMLTPPAATRTCHVARFCNFLIFCKTCCTDTLPFRHRAKKRTAGENVADARRPRTEQDAQKSSSSSVEPMAIRVLADGPSDENENIENVLGWIPRNCWARKLDFSIGVTPWSTAERKRSWSWWKFK